MLNNKLVMEIRILGPSWRYSCALSIFKTDESLYAFAYLCFVVS